MALPSRPNTRIGLPTNPSPRVRSRDLPSRPNSSASERRPPPSGFASPPPLPTLRNQHSYTNLSTVSEPINVHPRHTRSLTAARDLGSKRTPPPPLPVPKVPFAISSPRSGKEIPSSYSPPEGYYGGGRKESITSISSLSSGSSNSSLFSSRSPLSSSSSTTSLGYHEADTYDEEYTSSKSNKPVAGFGASLWDRLATTASNLTISVSKALEDNIATYKGELTPPGEESRLTKALKEYHISKASQPADLPEWLFEERDRRVGQRRYGMDVNPSATSPDADRGVITEPPSSSSALSSKVMTESSLRPSDRAVMVPIVPPPPPPSSILNISHIRQRTHSDHVAADDQNNRSRTLTRTAGAASSTVGRDRSRSRVKFAEQIHPRRAVSHSALREAASKETMPPPRVPPIPVTNRELGIAGVRFPTVGSKDSAPKMKPPTVDVRGRRPSARGLPSGVRPQIRV
ncbi:hypothetical protein C8Q75DRAFT_801964 [Abortiporus biennis]|nr:hypothetical protein C8Q75DRAFT_801964 [Abortiporus biennis]